jgi:ribosomal protein S18 acetylase RimI-like enzyme
MISVALDKKKHDRKYFDCGVDALNNYLRLMANQQSTKDNTRTYILENASDVQKIIGYYTLTMTSLDLTTLPKQLQNKHRNAHSAGLIARLAIDKRYKRQGFGEWLLIDSLRKLLLASETDGFPLVVVDAKEGAIEFYEKMGFTKFFDTEYKLYMTIADIRKSI